jgi:hypothetical protein
VADLGQERAESIADGSIGVLKRGPDLRYDLARSERYEDALFA